MGSDLTVGQHDVVFGRWVREQTLDRLVATVQKAHVLLPMGQHSERVRGNPGWRFAVRPPQLQSPRVLGKLRPQLPYCAVLAITCVNSELKMTSCSQSPPRRAESATTYRLVPY